MKRTRSSARLEAKRAAKDKDPPEYFHKLLVEDVQQVIRSFLVPSARLLLSLTSHRERQFAPPKTSLHPLPEALAQEGDPFGLLARTMWRLKKLAKHNNNQVQLAHVLFSAAILGGHQELVDCLRRHWCKLSVTQLLAILDHVCDNGDETAKTRALGLFKTPEKRRECLYACTSYTTLILLLPDV
jgi:hypothetical protein